MKISPRLAERIIAYLIENVANKREPDFIIGADSPEGPYLLRWFLTPWRQWQGDLRDRAKANPTRLNRAIAFAASLLPNVYLHCFLRDDEDRALHDHPSCAWSMIGRNGYREHTIEYGGVHRRQDFLPGSVRFMGFNHTHRIELFRRPDGSIIECWSLFSFGPAIREWFFHCAGGKVHWRIFTAAGRPGERGRGCD